MALSNNSNPGLQFLVSPNDSVVTITDKKREAINRGIIIFNSTLDLL